MHDDDDNVRKSDPTSATTSTTNNSDRDGQDTSSTGQDSYSTVGNQNDSRERSELNPNRYHGVLFVWHILSSLFSHPNQTLKAASSSDVRAEELAKGFAAPLLLLVFIISCIHLHFVGIEMSGYGTLYYTPSQAIMHSLLHFASQAIMVFVGAYFLSKLARTFSSQLSLRDGLKLMILSMSVGWLSNLFLLIPFLYLVVGLGGFIFSLYLFFRGLLYFGEVQPERRIAFGITTLICNFLVNLSMTLLFAVLFPSPALQIQQQILQSEREINPGSDAKSEVQRRIDEARRESAQP